MEGTKRQLDEGPDEQEEQEAGPPRPADDGDQEEEDADVGPNLPKAKKRKVCDAGVPRGAAPVPRRCMLRARGAAACVAAAAAFAAAPLAASKAHSISTPRRGATHTLYHRSCSLSSSTWTHCPARRCTRRATCTATRSRTQWCAPLSAALSRRFDERRFDERGGRVCCEPCSTFNHPHPYPTYPPPTLARSSPAATSWSPAA